VVRGGIAVLGLALVLAASPSAQNNNEDFARRQYDSGLSFLQAARYAEAMKDFQAVVDSFPQSAVADDALLQIALYHLEVAHDEAAAQGAADRLIKEYPNSNSAPMAYIIGGRLAITKGRTPADVDTALASFDRVPRLFPGSDAVAAARFFGGETLRLARRVDESLDRLRRVPMEYPQSIWAARADLATVASLVSLDRAPQAFVRLQRIRQQYPGTVEAAAALDYGTVLYRLYIRAKSQPAYAFSGRFIGAETSRFNDVMGVVVDDAGHVLLGHKQGVAIFDDKGTLTRSVNAAEPSAFFVEQRTRVVTVRKDMLVPDGAPPSQVAVPQTGKLPRPVEEIPAVVTLSNGDRLIADKSQKNVIRISPQGKYVSPFAAVNTEKMSRSEVDDVALIERDSKTIVLVDRDGKPLTRIPPKGTGYVMNDPIDVAFDSLGHLYVLDGGSKPAVYIFGPKNRLIATVASTGREAGALQRPKAMAVDAAGRLLVFDDSSKRIQVYQ
jgi:TolA-binding protein